MPEGLSVQFWGVRGSIGCGGSEIMRYGGNTSCVLLRCGDRHIIFDGGTGIRYLGNRLLVEDICDIDIFLSHAHLDHICGMPFFAPLFNDRAIIRIWGDLSESKTTLKEMFCGLMSSPFLPITPEIFRAKKIYQDFNSGSVLKPYDDITLTTIALNHPNGAVGYRLTYGGKTVCYVTDVEHRPERGLDADLIAFIRDCDLFIYDSTYTDEEYLRFKGYGHSTWQEGVRLSDAADVGRYVIFHHDPNHNDDFMDNVAHEADLARPGTVVAREGMVLTFATGDAA